MSQGDLATVPYLDQLAEILRHGNRSEDRTGTGTLSLFGLNARYPVTPQIFPLVTTKKVFWSGVVAELLWMLRGQTNVRPLQDQDVHLWDDWADAHGELGPVYGAQWRAWRNYDGTRTDQLGEILQSIKKNPQSRRHLLSAWNVGEIGKMALAPCHVLCQFYVNNNQLSCQLYQRSADMFLGVPFNIASYALLTMIVAKMTGLEPFELYHTIGDAHIYLNHVSQVEEQLSRQPLPAPRVKLKENFPSSLSKIQSSDIELIGYKPHPEIKAPISI